MLHAERQEAIKHVEGLADERFGDKKVVGLIQGTGWDVLNPHINIEGSFTHQEARLPGVSPELPPGHGNEIGVGTITHDGESAELIKIDKVHYYTGLSEPNAVESMYILLAGLRKHLKGCIISSGAGTLKPPFPLNYTAAELAEMEEREPGKVKWLQKQLDERIQGFAWAANGGRDPEYLNVGEVGVVHSVARQFAGDARHSFVNAAQSFQEICTGWIHTANDAYYKFAQEQLKKFQEGYAKGVKYADTIGPDYEPPDFKRWLAMAGVSMVGMSMSRSLMACGELGIPVVMYTLATNGMSAHDPFAIKDVGADAGSVILPLGFNTIKRWPELPVAA